MPDRRPAPPPPGTLLAPHVRAVVEAHLSDTTLSVARLAASVGLSRAQLFRRLKAETGLGPQAFVRAVRLDAAYARLRTGGATVGEVAHESGFHSASHFGRAFRRRFGCTPSDVQPP